MKKTFLAMLMGVAIISGSVALPVHTETVSAASISGNINWGSSNAVLPTDVTTAQTDCTFLGIKGSYITDMQNALDRINAIRKEACEEGVQDPRNSSRKLTSEDYVPIKWSSDLEYIARIRAAEASINISHTRLNGNSCFPVFSPNGVRSYGEVLAWNGTRRFLPGIEQWYEEKVDWVENTGEVTGHYTAMIDPDNVHVGLATFINPNAYYTTTTAGEFTSQSGLDESAGPAIENCIQTVEVKNDKITAEMSAFGDSLAAGNFVQAEFEIKVNERKAEPLGTVNWESSDGKSAAVSNAGLVTGVHEGSADITASYGGYTATQNITVTGHPNTELKNAKEATCSAEGYTGDTICKDCSLTIEKGTTIPKKAHSWDNGTITTQPTCTDAGVQTYTCTVCKTTKTETVPANGHKAVTDAGVAATCETDGKTEGSHCSVCNKVLTAQQTVKATGHNWDTGVVTKAATCEEKGEKLITCKTCGKTQTQVLAALGHDFGEWETVRAADVFDAEEQARTCSACGASEQRTAGSKLQGTMKINVSTLKLQVKQKTTALKVTGFAEGDSVVSWEISNKKIAKVSGKTNGTCTITAGNVKGSTKLTITLKSGVKKSVTVSVQKNAVQTQKISGITKTLKLKRKEKMVLHPVLTPLTSTEKVTYQSSNSKVAAVNSKGQITAKKKGTAVITVKSGKKTVKCKVTVK